MKKITKWFIIIAAIMTVSGIGLFIGGIMASGNIEIAKKELARQGIFIDNGFQVDINRSRRTIDNKEIELSDGKTAAFRIEEVKSLEFELGEAQIEIVENASAKEISINTDGNYDIYVKNGTLHMKTKKSLEDHTVLMEIPANAVFEHVDISVGACAMEIQRMEVKELDVEVGAGQVIIEDLVANSAEFEIGAGEIIVNYGNVQQCDINVGIGNFEYNGAVTKYSDIECGMGNVEMYIEGNEEDYNYEIDCAAGNVTIGDESFGGLASERTIHNGADAAMEIDCSMGNVTIGF